MTKRFQRLVRLAALFTAGLCHLWAPTRAWSAAPSEGAAPAAQSESKDIGKELTRMRRLMELGDDTLAQRLKEQAKERETELKSLKAKLDAALKELDQISLRGTDVDTRLIAVERSIKESQASLTALAGTTRRLDEVDSLGKRHSDDLTALSDTVAALQKGLAKDLQEIRDFRDDFELKARRLEGVIDLMNAMRKDINNNAKGLVDLQKEIDDFTRPPEKESKGGDGWFEKAARWPYLPAVAVGLSALAVGLAAQR